MQPSLGRIVSPTDFRDHQFLARAIAPRPEPGVVRRRWWTPDPWDQGQTPECVAFSSLLWLNAGPVRNKSANASGADAYYAMCQQIDGWPLPHEGTSVRASMQVAQQLGYIKEYRWAFTVDDVSRWILTVGPCVLGIDWLNSMFDTDQYKKSTFIRWNPTSGIAGGHAICAHEVDIHKLCPDGTHGAVGIQNSWGAEWGNNGRAWLSFTALAALLRKMGSASMAQEIVRPVAKAA
jgi:hypothetical protein